MNQFSKFVWMDVHMATIAVSIADANGGDVRYVGEIANTPEAIEKAGSAVKKRDAHISFCYETGPCGYGIQRQLSDLGWDCQVVAPSLIPREAGERLKTECRDSLKLALASSRSTDCSVGSRRCAGRATRLNPSARGHEASSAPRQATFVCLSASIWETLQRKEQLDSGTLSTAARATVQAISSVDRVSEYVDTVKALSKRVDGLDTQLESAARESLFWPVIEGLTALRGVNLLTAMTVVADSVI